MLKLNVNLVVAKKGHKPSLWDCDVGSHLQVLNKVLNKLQKLIAQHFLEQQMVKSPKL